MLQRYELNAVNLALCAVRYVASWWCALCCVWYVQNARSVICGSRYAVPILHCAWCAVRYAVHLVVCVFRCALGVIRRALSDVR